MPGHTNSNRRALYIAITAVPVTMASLAFSMGAEAAVQCARTVTANVVAIDQPLMYNRLGAQNVNGMMYALKNDVVNRTSGLPLTAGGAATPGGVELRPDKRPRPIVLRVAAGDCLQVNFENLLAPVSNPRQAPDANLAGQAFNIQIDDQVADRHAGFHPQGLELVGSIASDASFTGNNASSLVAPGESAVYNFYAPKEGSFLAVSYGASFGGDGTSGNIGNGLFGVVNVQPSSPTAGATRFFRSQLTEEDMRLATTGYTAEGQPILDYAATYPNIEPFISEGKAGLPIIDMLTPANELVHSDINAIIAGPNPDGTFSPDTYPLESVGKRNPTVPTRLEAFREFTVAFHDENPVAQVFPQWFLDPVLKHTLHGVRDAFLINYGSGGIGSEIIANRLGVGPMHDCLTCAYEEFFLTAFTVGDVGQVVDVPANAGLEACTPALQNCADVGPKANHTLYPDDPSNVHHSYMSDFVKFRNVHAGKEQHVFHLHNHQWLFNPNDDNSNYLDAQGIGPGSGYTYEINFGGSGNRNKSAGDAIFHCHFYPHFAQGMWDMWRIHDVMEVGTELAASNGDIHSTPFALGVGLPAAGARALPDGEIVAGTPIPAVVPLPGKAMAPMPSTVTVVANPATRLAAPSHATPGAVVPVGSLASIARETGALVDPEFNPTGLKNPGYPFWIAGIEDMVGQRPPTPPFDMFGAREDAAVAGVDGGWDGGLPRHALLGYSSGGTSHNTQNRLDFTKVVLKAKPVYYAEEGTDIERAAMAFHAVRTRASTALKLDGSTTPASFITNGARPIAGAPFHEPCMDDEGDLFLTGQQGDFFDGSGGLGTKGVPQFGADAPRVYKGTNIQFDAVFNKAGYHFPQQRIITLWEDAVPTINKVKAPEPLVLRLNTFDCAMYLHTNLVPEVYEMDDYQVRTPTDIIGQHIHLPKWDLTTTDGAANGWNYEDGTLSPGAVRERIEAINHWVDEHAPGTPHLEPEAHPFFGQFAQGQCPGGPWCGARTTLQRWFADPVVNVAGEDRGLGIIFTHDHYGPSTHQQIGLYATVLAEPAGSTWVHNETGTPLYTRPDGGPTSWQAAITQTDGNVPFTADKFKSFREFYFEYSDFQSAYEKGVYIGANEFGEPFDTRTDPAPGHPHPGPVQAPDPNSFVFAINPSYRQQANPQFPDVGLHFPGCPGGVLRPCPEAISADDPGMLVVNYRNEPVGLRVFDPNRIGPDGKPGTQAAGLAGDLAFALESRTDRAIAQFNTKLGDTPYPALNNDLNNGDPFTPMIRAQAGDPVKVKIQAGAHEHEHNASIQGVKWLQAGSGHGSAPNSGWRNAQNAGISEQFTFSAPIVDVDGQVGNRVDRFYSVDMSHDGFWSGMWGLMRTYGTPRNDLYELPDGTRGQFVIANRNQFNGVCPANAPVRAYDLTAVLANNVLGNTIGAAIVPGDLSATMHEGGPLDPNGGTLVYNPRPTQIETALVDTEGGGQVTIGGQQGGLHDPTGVMYVRTSDLDANGKLKAGAPVEPVVLRAAAGDCIVVTLRNALPAVMPDLAGFNTLLQVVNRDRDPVNGLTWFHNNLVRPSSHIALQPQLVAVDVSRHGPKVGQNNFGNLMVAPGQTGTARFYAGDIDFVSVGNQNGRNNRVDLVATPIEFGGSNLLPADKIKQGQKGLIGSLVIEPQGSSWVENDVTNDHQTNAPGATRQTRASATVTRGDGSTFRDFVVMVQKGQNHRFIDGRAVPNTAAEGQGIPEDSHDAGQMAVNYGSEPLWFRFGKAPDAPFGRANGAGLGDVPNAHEAYSNGLVGGDPVTPVFKVTAGSDVRMRVLEPTGAGRGTTFNLHGHVWQRDPYVCPGSADLGLIGKCTGTDVASQAIGNNPVGMSLGAQESVTPAAHFDVVVEAGGTDQVVGDYLFRDAASFGNLGGVWGIMRVE